jgi:hypothetical protein
MVSKDGKKESVDKIRDKLVGEFGKEEFERLLDETRKNWVRESGAWPSPSEEDLVLALDYSINEQKRKKASQSLLAREFFFLDGVKVLVDYDGENWKIYYFPIDYFEFDLRSLGKFLDSLEEKGERIEAVVPNIGRVRMTTLECVKGFAVIVKKHKNNRQ